MPEQTCVVCHSKPGPVCDDDQAALTRMLTALPQRLRQLSTALLPGQTEPGERVAAPGKVTAPLPARLDALSIVGPGTSEITVRLNPLVRHWSAKRRVSVQTHVAGRVSVTEVEVTDWFHETVIGPDGRPVLVPEDDQVGTVPPREWLDSQVRRWRAHFGHAVPNRTVPARPAPTTHLSGRHRTLLRVRGGDRVLAFLLAAAKVGSDWQRAAHFGLLGYQEPAERSLDPLLDDIERRFGEPPRDLAVAWDVNYLTTWLAAAAEVPELDIADFAAQLRTLHAEIGRALGETPDQQWIGRCPTFIADIPPIGFDDNGDPLMPELAEVKRRPCGAGLWQDNTQFAAQVQCPRCHTLHDTRGPGAATLAREIRRVWPLDRRRRYTATDIDVLRVPKCPACGERVRVDWKEVTGTRDKQRTWTPSTVSCPTGCDDARRVM
ncbi:hypothetical protein AB0F93_00550 [Micromonospora tulbaghiae]|uniref:hypothetical protein n=1 Tax=Micromonospora tulbaghiae TaxID=479978 RepID=UPI003320B855